MARMSGWLAGLKAAKAWCQAARWSGAWWLGSGPIGSPGWSYPYISRYAAIEAALSSQCRRAAESAGTAPRAGVGQARGGSGLGGPPRPGGAALLATRP